MLCRIRSPRGRDGADERFTRQHGYICQDFGIHAESQDQTADQKIDQTGNIAVRSDKESIPIVRSMNQPNRIEIGICSTCSALKSLRRIASWTRISSRLNAIVNCPSVNGKFRLST